MNPDIQLYFNEPRLKMTLAGRLIVRLCSYASYAILAVAAALFLLGDVPQLRSVGALIALFLLDRLRTFNMANRSLARLPRGRANAADYLTPSAYAAIEWAVDRAVFSGGNVYLHLLKKLISRSEIGAGLLRMDVRPDDLEAQADKLLSGVVSVKEGRNVIFERIGGLAASAFWGASEAAGGAIEPKDIFAALALIGDPAITKIFQFFNINGSDLASALLASRFRSAFSRLARMPGSLVGLLTTVHRSHRRIMNRAWTARPTPLLDQFSRDLTDLARSEAIGFLIGHQKEYDRLEDVLSRPGRSNVLLVGDPGSGKSTLVAHLAFEMVHDRVPQPLFDKRLIELEIGSLISGANEDELEDRVNRIIGEIVTAGNIILYIPDIHNLLRTSGQGRMSAADVFIPAIKNGAISVIGATYPREFKQYLEANSDFVGSFELVRVEEISEAEALRLLSFESILLERQFKTVIGFSALKKSIELARKYFHQKPLPGNAEDLLKEALADAVGKRKKILSAADVITVAEKKVNIPMHQAGQEEAAQLLNLEEVIHERFIDQTEAVSAVARSLREYRSGLSRKGGPIATFLFVGPTGVGKTELSKILAKIQFGSQEAMVRLDMSEYQDKSSINRLVGMPDGSSSGNLTGIIAEKPYCLILLDEFEKAHPDILNLFLQVFDDGRLTDSLGRTVDFQNTIIIATSNAHSTFIQSEIAAGASIKNLSAQIKKKLTEYFRPELLNRFSEIVVFKPLAEGDIEKVARIQLADLAATLEESQGISLRFSAAAVVELAKRGFDPSFGARPLRAAISENVKAALSEKILKEEIKKGDNIEVEFSEGKFVFRNV